MSNPVKFKYINQENKKTMRGQEYGSNYYIRKREH